MMMVLVRPLHQVPQRCGAITDCEGARGTPEAQHRKASPGETQQMRQVF